MRFFGFNNPKQGAVTGITLAAAAWLLLAKNMLAENCNSDNSLLNSGCSLLFKSIMFVISPVPGLAGCIGFRIGELQQENAQARFAPRV